MAIQSDHLPSVQDAPEHGTPIINYVGPAALEPQPEQIEPAPPIEPTQFPGDAQQPDPDRRARTWAERIQSGLFFAVLGVSVYESIVIAHQWLELLWLPVIIAIWLVGIGVAKARSHYAEWGFVTVVSAIWLPLLMDSGLWRVLDYVNMADWLAKNGYSPDTLELSQGIAYLGLALGFMLLAGFAALKSLRRWRAGASLFLLVATVVGSLMVEYHYGTVIYPYESAMIGNMNQWGQRIIVLALAFIFLLYALPGGKKPPRDNPPEEFDVKVHEG